MAHDRGLRWTASSVSCIRGEFADSGYKITELYTNKAGEMNKRKTPLYTAMESLRKDIATYDEGSFKKILLKYPLFY
jgi:hypothetical protein